MKPIEILLVDDNPGDQKLFKEAIAETRIDHQLRFASSTQECLSMLAVKKPDLIFMDVILPGLSGRDFVRVLHKDPTTRMIPVYFLTGLVDGKQNAEMDNKLNIAGVSYPVLKKPVDAPKLINIMAKIKV